MYQYYISEYFKKQLKPLVKKHPHLLAEIITALKDFAPEHAASLGARTYKIRVANKNSGHGKSGAFRLIVLLISVEDLLVPITMYAKSDQSSITKKDIQKHIERVREEL